MLLPHLSPHVPEMACYSSPVKGDMTLLLYPPPPPRAPGPAHFLCSSWLANTCAHSKICLRCLRAVETWGSGWLPGDIPGDISLQETIPLH